MCVVIIYDPKLSIMSIRSRDPENDLISKNEVNDLQLVPPLDRSPDQRPKKEYH